MEELGGSIKELEELENEIGVLNQLDHPNVLRIFEVYSCPKRYYIVSELLEGGELFDQIV